MNRRAVGGAGIAHGTGDLAIANLTDGVNHSGDGILKLGIGQDREQRGEGLRNGLGGNDGDLLVGAGRSGSLGSHADVAVIGQDDDRGRVDLVHRAQQVGSRGVHGLATRDDHVNAEGLENVCLAGTSGNGDKTQRLGRLGGLFLVLVDLGGTVVGLHLHVVDKDLVDLTELQHVLEHQVGRVGVHVDLVVGVGTHEQLAVAHGTQELKALVLVKRGVGLKEELVAVAELRALPVVVGLDLNATEGRVAGRAGGIKRGGEILDNGAAAKRGGNKVLQEDGKAKGAGVDHAVLLQNGQQVGRAGDGLVGLDDDGIERVLGRELLLFALVGLGRDITQHREDRALDGLADGLEGDLDGATEGEGDVGRRNGLIGRDEALGHAAQNLRGDDAGVAAGTHQGAVGDGAGDGFHIGIGGKGGELLGHRGERERHVGTGVAVGYGEDVELVDLLGLVGNGSRSDRKTGANGLCNHGYLNLRFRMLVQTTLERVDVDADLKAGGIDLGDLLQGKGNGARKIVADGLHVDAVLEHDVKIDRKAVLVGGDKHALAEALTGKQAHALGALELFGHTDDAIARHRGITGNIGNNVVRDAQAAVNGLRHKNLLSGARGTISWEQSLQYSTTTAPC